MVVYVLVRGLARAATWDAYGRQQFEGETFLQLRSINVFGETAIFLFQRLPCTGSVISHDYLVSDSMPSRHAPSLGHRSFRRSAEGARSTSGPSVVRRLGAAHVVAMRTHALGTRA